MILRLSHPSSASRTALSPGWGNPSTSFGMSSVNSSPRILTRSERGEEEEEEEEVEGEEEEEEGEEEESG